MDRMRLDPFSTYIPRLLGPSIVKGDNPTYSSHRVLSFSLSLSSHVSLSLISSFDFDDCLRREMVLRRARTKRMDRVQNDGCKAINYL